MTYSFVKVTGSRVSLTLVSHRLGGPRRPCVSWTSRVVLRKKIAPLLPSRSTLRKYIFVSLCLFTLIRFSSRDTFFLFSAMALRLFISCSNATDAPCEREGFGAWSILLMAHTRIVVYLSLKDCAVPSLLYKRM